MDKESLAGEEEFAEEEGSEDEEEVPNEKEVPAPKRKSRAGSSRSSTRPSAGLMFEISTMIRDDIAGIHERHQTRMTSSMHWD